MIKMLNTELPVASLDMCVCVCFHWRQMIPFKCVLIQLQGSDGVCVYECVHILSMVSATEKCVCLACV